MLNKLYRTNATRIYQLLKAMTPKRTQISTARPSLPSFCYHRSLSVFTQWVHMLIYRLTFQWYKRIWSLSPLIWFVLQVSLVIQQLPNGWSRYGETQMCIRSNCLCQTSPHVHFETAKNLYFYLYTSTPFIPIDWKILSITLRKTLNKINERKTSIYFQMTLPSPLLLILFNVRGQVINYLSNWLLYGKQLT